MTQAGPMEKCNRAVQAATAADSPLQSHPSQAELILSPFRGRDPILLPTSCILAADAQMLRRQLRAVPLVVRANDP